MPIEPISNSHREISVVEPISLAFERVKQMLFAPFDLGKWFVIGFCAWLAGLGESGGGFNYTNSFGNSNKPSPAQNFHHYYDQAHDYVLANLYWIVPVAALVILFCIVIGLVVLWLNSRGKFMFLHCVALDKAEVAEPWKKFRDSANSLFWFRIVVSLIGTVLMMPLLIVIALSVIKMIARGEVEFFAILISIGCAMILFLFVIIFAIIQKFTVDFIVPIMFLRSEKCLAAWKEFWSLLCANAGQFALYILFQIVIGMAIGMIVVFAVLLTCCIAGCFMMIPYIGTVLLLPVLIFKRAYSLYFLQQFGTAYDVFPPTPPAAPIATGLQPLPGTPPTL
jgi:hypothetical protein